MVSAEQAGGIAPLVTGTDRLVAATADWPDLHARAEGLRHRVVSGEFRVAVVGEFKRGKSTLLNALISRSILPMGVLPVTAVPIELATGNEGATVVFSSGDREEIGLADLARFTTEAENPDNRLGVDRVEARLRSPLLDRGLTLVDVPGTGSVHEAATETAMRTYDRVDGAILVLAADSPLSAGERRAAEDLRGRGGQLFVVVNKADAIGLQELDDVRAFVAEALRLPFDALYCVSARAALAENPASAGDFEGLVGALQQFIDHDLEATRQAVLVHELGQLASELRGRATLERLAGELDLEDLQRKIEVFETAVGDERARAEGERRAIAVEVASLRDGVRNRLRADAATVAALRRDAIQALVPTRGSLLRARRTVEEAIPPIVRLEVAGFFDTEARWAGEAWAALAERHRRDTESRLDAVRAVAAELFSADLPPVSVPEIPSEATDNLYRFVPAVSLADAWLDPIRAVVPVRWRASSMRARAVASFTQEVDKHAGRASALLGDRLVASWQEFALATKSQLDAAIDGFSGALARAVDAHASAATETETRARRLDEILAVTSNVTDVP